jgi:hypothetical protein
MKTSAAVVLVGVLGCGGRVGDGDAGDASLDHALVDGLNSDGGWTNCAAPSGVSICGGPNDCGSQCSECFPAVQDAGELHVCDDVLFQFAPDASVAADTFLCPDGALNACIYDENSPICWQDACTTEDLPQLWLMNGRADLAKYADRSTYTGAPLPPLPMSCPTVATGMKLCGGACGTCADTDVCTGRSPLHPYSLCVTAEPESFPCVRGTSGSCNALRPGFMCLTYQVDSAAQPIADQGSLCVPALICQAAAQSYPGGAFCTPGS